MAVDFDDIKKKATEMYNEAKDSKIVDKVKKGVKDIDVEKLKEKSQDILDESKKSYKRVSKEVGKQIDKLKK